MPIDSYRWRLRTIRSPSIRTLSKSSIWLAPYELGSHSGKKVMVEHVIWCVWRGWTALKCYSANMVADTKQVRVNIYLDDPEMRREIKIAAANRGVTQSAYCVEAIRQRLERERSAETAAGSRQRSRDVAKALDQLRAEIGPVGIPVRDLIDEGRRG